MKVNILRFQRFVCPMFISPKQHYTCFYALFFGIYENNTMKNVVQLLYFKRCPCFFEMHLNNSSALLNAQCMKCLLQNQAHAKTEREKKVHTLLPYISGWRVFFCLCALFFCWISGERRNPALENSRPVKRIMSTISKHSEEAEDDEICSGNLWIINEHFEWIPWKKTDLNAPLTGE